MSKVKVSKVATSKDGVKSPRVSKRSDRGDDRVEAIEEHEDVERPGSSRGVRGINWLSNERVGEGVELVVTNSEGYGGDGMECVVEAEGDVVDNVGSLAVAACCAALFAALRLFLEASGSLMKIHSLPLDEHLEQGYCRLHLTFDSAQAYKACE